jgi:uncharacterized lipoprotein
MHKNLVFGLLVVALAGCGGGSKEDFIAKADKICTAQAKKLDVKEPQTMQDLKQAADHNLPILNAMVEKLDKLEPPKNLETKVDKFVANARLRASITKQASTAAAEQDLPKLQEISATATKGRADGKKLGQDVGFKSCGQG